MSEKSSRGEATMHEIPTACLPSHGCSHEIQEREVGHTWTANHISSANPSLLAPDDRLLGDHSTCGTQSRTVSPELIDRLRYWHRQRRFFMGLRNKQLLSLGSHVRLAMGWTPEMKGTKEGKRLLARASALIDGKLPDDPLLAELGPAISATLLGMEPSQREMRNAEREMARLVRQLPVHPWAEALKGLGDLSLAAIVGECGDLAGYASPAKLWKRMGMAVMDGRRQGSPGEGASAEDWIAHGYSPSRRSIMWNIGEALVKKRAYRDVYEARRAHTAVTHPEWTKLHSNNDAKRYITKRLLRDLWRAWRAAGHRSTDTQPAHASGSSLPGDHSSFDIQNPCVPGIDIEEKAA